MSERWWFVARVKRGIQKNTAGCEILSGEMPFTSEFFEQGDEVWITETSTKGIFLLASPVPGGRVMRVPKDLLPTYIEPRQPWRDNEDRPAV